MKDFASLDFASPLRTGFSTWRRAVLALAIGSVIATSTGCSVMSTVGNTLLFWRGGDDEAAQYDADEMTLQLGATRAEMTAAPREPYWPFRMGELYASSDSTSQSITYLQKSLETDAGYAPAAALLSKIYYEQGMFEEGSHLLTGFLDKNPEAPDALRAALALHREAVGDLDGAHAILAECSDNSAEVRAARTYVTLRDDDLKAALEMARQTLADNPKSAAAHNNYGISLLWSGQPAEARDAFTKALKLNDKLPGALYNMAIVEAFYFFNEEAGREWFARYKQFANDDPDDLTSVLGADVSKLLKIEPVN